MKQLWGVDAIDDGHPCDPRRFSESAGRQLLQLDGPRRLIEFLSPEPQRPGVSLVEALVQILFVPRRQRTEYLDNSLPTPPWSITRLLLEYAVWSVRIDELLGALTKVFCARACQRLPVGCCSVLGYDMGMVPHAMLRAQRLEARGDGWSAPAVETHCKYHGPAGCCLRLFKSPACAGMLCDELVQELRGRFAAPPLSAFLEALARYRNHLLDREQIFTSMAEVIQTGQAMITPWNAR